MLLAGLTAAAGIRALLGRPDPASSQPAALLFAVLLALLAVASGLRVSRPSTRWLAGGAAFGVVLFFLWVAATGSWTVLRPASASAALLTWSVVVSLVAVAEELLLRGALFTAIAGAAGDATALIATSVAFALIHVPLYGWPAVPVDLGVGLVLGCLRLLSGGA
ncbi:MAG: CPBP family intramembrane metalloprotease, partial [Chloroflexi bacterium]|nr:CPBP family intramembrane metalloprotease [Chloroflexota bacterium]